MARRKKMLQSIDIANTRGVEIGPLANPVLKKNEARVLYADHANTEKLRKKYAGHGWNTDDIVNVDVVLSDEPIFESLQRTKVDFFIASHVIEHVPNMIQWLDELHNALNPGGKVVLAIPDARYCFDAQRPLSTTGDLVDAWIQKRTIPSLKQVFDFWALYTVVDATSVWSGKIDTSQLHSAGTLENALSKTRSIAQKPGYTDIHCWVFTPHSFLHCLADLKTLDLLKFDVKHFHDTARNDCEFFVTLERVEETNGESEKVFYEAFDFPD